MANLANLVVKINANGTALTRGLSRAGKRIKRFASNAKKVMKGIKKAFLGVGAAAGLISFAVIRGTKNLDKLAKTARKIGAPIRALQKLQFQANLSGVSTETLNMALQRMVRRVAEAAKGTGEAVNALKELGIDAAALNQLSPDQQFMRLAGAFRSVGQQSDKVRLAMKLFDSEGVALVNTLSSDLAGASGEFDRLGVAVSDSQARAAEAFQDTILKVKTLWQSFIMQVASDFAPVLDDVLNKVIGVIEEMGGLKDIAKTVTNSLIKGFTIVTDTVLFLRDSIASVKKGLDAIRLGAGGAIAAGGQSILDSELFQNTPGVNAQLQDSTQ